MRISLLRRRCYLVDSWSYGKWCHHELVDRAVLRVSQSGGLIFVYMDHNVIPPAELCIHNLHNGKTTHLGRMPFPYDWQAYHFLREDPDHVPVTDRRHCSVYFKVFYRGIASFEHAESGKFLGVAVFEFPTDGDLVLEASGVESKNQFAGSMVRVWRTLFSYGVWSMGYRGSKLSNRRLRPFLRLLRLEDASGWTVRELDRLRGRRSASKLYKERYLAEFTSWSEAPVPEILTSTEAIAFKNPLSIAWRTTFQPYSLKYLALKKFFGVHDDDVSVRGFTGSQWNKATGVGLGHHFKK